MSVVADFTVPADSFALHHALTADPDVTIKAERLASHSPEWSLPFIWASGGDFEAFEEAMQEDPTVVEASAIEKMHGDALYKVQWSQDVLDLITEMIDQHAIILNAQARAEEWRLQLRFAEEGQISSFQEYFSEENRSFEVNKIYHPNTSRQREYGLTREQHDTLVAAFQRGYFSVPRDTSMEELANELGISSNAVSQRIRRGSANLIQHALTMELSDLTNK